MFIIPFDLQFITNVKLEIVQCSKNIFMAIFSLIKFIVEINTYPSIKKVVWYYSEINVQWKWLTKFQLCKKFEYINFEVYCRTHCIFLDFLVMKKVPRSIVFMEYYSLPPKID